MTRNHVLKAVVTIGAICLCGLTGAQSDQRPNQIVTIDASHAVLPPTKDLAFGGTSPAGHTIAVNSRYLLMDGKPWLPVMGEFHYSRYPDQYWEEELLKMKAGGVEIVATYVFWNHHEEVAGQFDWSGRRDLRRFLELARKHDLLVFLRIGPYGHGEVRRGGLPDWLVAKCPIRRNDPVYLEYVRRYFGQLGEQVRGLMWKDGGPVIGVQLENEYYSRGPDAGAAHMRELKKIANQAGIVAPLYTATGWENPDLPAGEVIRVFGGYPDNFWESTLEELAPSGFYLFDFERAANPVQASGNNSKPAQPDQPYPLFMAEAGGGIQVAYHRRPKIDSDDVAAMTLTRLGSGANLYGYYMFHGGTNPDGKLTTLQETAETDGVYDLPVLTYDFQAPLGQFGQMNPVFRAIRPFHQFLNAFGSQLAPAAPMRPAVIPADERDSSVPRVAARLAGNRGFLFINNYRRTYPLPEMRAVQIELRLPSETLRLPRRLVDIPSGAYFMWPINFDLGGAVLKYATAQLLTKVRDGGDNYYFFSAQPDIAVEFAFQQSTVKWLEAGTARVERGAGTVYVTGITPGYCRAMSVTATDGKTTYIVVLTRQQAENATRLSLGGSEHLFISPADLFVGGEKLHLRARDVDNLRFLVFPGLSGRLYADEALRPKSREGIFDEYTASVTPKSVQVQWKKIRTAEPSHPVRKGKYNAVAPAEVDFEHAGVWQVQVPKNTLSGLDDAFLRVRYTGDIARVYAGRHLLLDDYYNGSIWEIGLERFAKEISVGPLELKIMPLRKDAPFYLPKPAWPVFPSSGEVAEIHEIEVSPEYEVVLDLSHK